VYTYTAKTMSGLLDSMTLDIMRAPSDELDVISNVDVAKQNVMGYAEHMDYEFDLKTIWLGTARWSMMVRQYLDRDEVMSWLHQASTKIGKRGRGQAVLRTRIVKPRGGAATGHTNMQTRKWGSCMLSLSYRALPTPTITLHSRTSYLGYLSALDFNIAHVLGRYLADQIGISVKDMSFVWMVESVQWHGFKSLPFAICNSDPKIRRYYRRLLTKKFDDLDAEELIESQTPAMLVTRRWVNYVRREDQAGMTLGDTNYNTYRRVRRRWHTEVLGYKKAQEFEGWSHDRNTGERKEFFKAYKPLPSVMTSSLDLSPLKLPFGGAWVSNIDLTEDINEADTMCLYCGETEYDECEED
jgi:hypothetical protein